MRKGKLHGQTKIMIPYIDEEGQRQFHMITLNGTVYASKMYAGIKQFVLATHGEKVDKDWLENVPLIVNSHDPQVQISEEERQSIIDAFIDRMELKDDPIEDSADSGSESEAAVETGEPLCTVPNQPLAV